METAHITANNGQQYIGVRETLGGEEIFTLLKLVKVLTADYGLVESTVKVQQYSACNMTESSVEAQAMADAIEFDAIVTLDPSECNFE